MDAKEGEIIKEETVSNKSVEENNDLSKEKQGEAIYRREKESEEVNKDSKLPDIMDCPPEMPGAEIDTILEIHQVNADKLLINVSDIDARVNLNIEPMESLQIKAGVQVHLDEAKVLIQDVRAEAYLQVRLDRVKSIVDNLTDLDENNADVSVIPITEGSGGINSNIMDRTGEVLTDLNAKEITEAAKKSN